MLWIIIIFLFLRQQEWLECLSKIKCNKNEKKYLFVHFSMLAGPFKQTEVVGASSCGLSLLLFHSFGFRGRIFSSAWPFYEWAVSDLDP
jgi:hypothetical protein